MIEPQKQNLPSEIINEDRIEMLYEFGEILESLKSSIANKTPLCFFLLNEDVEICISPVKKILESPAGIDRREMEIMLDLEDMVIKLHNIAAVGQYEQYKD